MNVQELKDKIGKPKYSPPLNPDSNIYKHYPRSTPIRNPIFPQTSLLAIPYPPKLIYHQTHSPPQNPYQNPEQSLIYQKRKTTTKTQPSWWFS